jgi:hypothetical protein
MIMKEHFGKILNVSAVTYLKYYSEIRLKGLRKTMKIFCPFSNQYEILNDIHPK